jgi:hypothetical protein
MLCDLYTKEIKPKELSPKHAYKKTLLRVKRGVAVLAL